MSYPSIDEIAVQVKDWTFVNALPEEFKGFTKKIKIEKQGQVLFYLQLHKRSPESTA